MIPKYVIVIKSNVFHDCSRLRKVTFPDDSTLEEIGSWCFSGSGIEEFYAPQNLKKIGANAFADCKNLKTVVLNEGLETLGERITETDEYNSY